MHIQFQISLNLISSRFKFDVPIQTPTTCPMKNAGISRDKTLQCKLMYNTIMINKITPYVD